MNWRSFWLGVLAGSVLWWAMLVQSIRTFFSAEADSEQPEGEGRSRDETSGADFWC